MLTRTAAKVARNPERLRNPSFQQHNNAQLLSSRNAKTRMLSFSGSRKHLTGSSFPTKRNEKKRDRMLTPNGSESSEDGCETLRSSKKRKNTDAQLLRFNKTLHRFGFSNETNQRNEPTRKCSPERLRKEMPTF
jgi:hypothetical protein